jgi:hypothetical protein
MDTNELIKLIEERIRIRKKYKWLMKRIKFWKDFK